jgi:septum formation protein
VPDFDVIPSAVEEQLAPGDLPRAVAALALEKARAVAAGQRQAVVLGADTVVVVDGCVLGKPAGPDEARAMLRRLRGREHEVITGIAVVDTETGRARATAVVSRVVMAEYSDAAIDVYVASGEPLDKAGAYAVQGMGGRFVARLEGSYSNVVGLPLEETGALLADFGLPGRRPLSGSAGT